MRKACSFPGGKEGKWREVFWFFIIKKYKRKKKQLNFIILIHDIKVSKCIRI